MQANIAKVSDAEGKLIPALTVLLSTGDTPKLTRNSVKFLLLSLDFFVGALEEQRGDGKLRRVEAFQPSHVKLLQSVHQSPQKRVHFRLQRSSKLELEVVH